MTTRAILFDIDGTLVDSNDMHVVAWQEAFASVDATFDAGAIHSQIGKGTDMLVPHFLPDADEDLQKKLGELHGDIFKARFLEQVRPFDGAHDLLARVHAAGQTVVLASSASAEELEH
jgi:phosphoglycolate phosphatase-like HAD superfamily hydrolase